MTTAGRKAAAAAVVVVLIGLLCWVFAPPAAGPQMVPGAPLAGATGASAVALSTAPPARVGSPVAGPASTASQAAPPPVVPLGSNEVPDLRADAKGHLVVDAHTRNELEKLIALNDRVAALALLQRLETELPPTAYRQAVDAFYAYQNYSIAAAQLVSPSQPITDEAGALQQLDALHALRIQQLGPEVTQAYFGEEEALSRRLIADMRAQPGNGSSLAERAEQAQRGSTPAR